MLNADKKQKIVRKTNKRGLHLKESDINLLSVKDNPMYESVSSSDDSDNYYSDRTASPRADHEA